MHEIPVGLLHAFVVFNRSPNIDAAARKLGITQPALSKQLKALESQLPAKVFTQRGRKKVLTAVGRELDARIGERLSGLGEVLRQTFGAHAEPAHARVRIVARRGILDRLSERFAFSGALELHEAGNEEIIDDVLACRADIGIAHAVPDTLELLAKPLFTETFKLVVPNQLCARAGFSKRFIGELALAPCLAFKRRDEVLLALVASFGVDPRGLRVRRVTANYGALASMAAAGLGWTVVPSYIETPGATWSVSVPTKLLPPRKFHVLLRREILGAHWYRELEKGLRSAFSTIET